MAMKAMNFGIKFEKEWFHRHVLNPEKEGVGQYMYNEIPFGQHYKLGHAVSIGKQRKERGYERKAN